MIVPVCVTTDAMRARRIIIAILSLPELLCDWLVAILNAACMRHGARCVLECMMTLEKIMQTATVVAIVRHTVQTSCDVYNVVFIYVCMQVFILCCGSEAQQSPGQARCTACACTHACMPG